VVDRVPEHLFLELELVLDVIPAISLQPVLIMADNVELPIFADNLADVLDEAVEGLDLLAHQPVLLEVAVDDPPGVLLSDLLLLLLHRL
jgi:hypothetical protein